MANKVTIYTLTTKGSADLLAGSPFIAQQVALQAARHMRLDQAAGNEQEKNRVLELSDNDFLGDIREIVLPDDREWIAVTESVSRDGEDIPATAFARLGETGRAIIEKRSGQDSTLFLRAGVLFEKAFGRDDQDRRIVVSTAAVASNPPPGVKPTEKAVYSYWREGVEPDMADCDVYLSSAELVAAVRAASMSWAGDDNEKARIGAMSDEEFIAHDKIQIMATVLPKNGHWVELPDYIRQGDVSSRAFARLEKDEILIEKFVGRGGAPELELDGGVLYHVNSPWAWVPAASNPQHVLCPPLAVQTWAQGPISLVAKTPDNLAAMWARLDGCVAVMNRGQVNNEVTCLCEEKTQEGVVRNFLHPDRGYAPENFQTPAEDHAGTKMLVGYLQDIIYYAEAGNFVDVFAALSNEGRSAEKLQLPNENGESLMEVVNRAMPPKDVESIRDLFTRHMIETIGQNKFSHELLSQIRYCNFDLVHKTTNDATNHSRIDTIGTASVRTGCHAVLAEFLKCRGNPNQETQYGVTLIQDAAMRSDATAVHLLSQYGAKLDDAGALQLSAVAFTAADQQSGDFRVSDELERVGGGAAAVGQGMLFGNAATFGYGPSPDHANHIVSLPA